MSMSSEGLGFDGTWIAKLDAEFEGAEDVRGFVEEDVVMEKEVVFVGAETALKAGEAKVVVVVAVDTIGEGAAETM